MELTTPVGAVRARAAILTVSTAVLAGSTIRLPPGLDAWRHAAARLPLGRDEKLFIEIVGESSFAPETRVIGNPRDRRRPLALGKGELRRETPIILTLDDGGLVEGVVDLAFREDTPDFDGWTVLDFKTDREFARSSEIYTAQVSLYSGLFGRRPGCLREASCWWSDRKDGRASCRELFCRNARILSFTAS